MPFPVLTGRIAAVAAIVAAGLFCAIPRARADATSDNWAKDCAACHGRDGAGHTKAGRQVKVKDLTSSEYQKSFTDADAFKDVKDGVQTKDGVAKMKPFKDKLSDDEIKALIAYVRTLVK